MACVPCLLDGTANDGGNMPADDVGDRSERVGMLILAEGEEEGRERNRDSRGRMSRTE